MKNFLVLCFSFLAAFAGEPYLINKLMENQDYCIAVLDGDKIFLRPENIIASDQGIWIQLNRSEWCPLPLLQFDQFGYFIESNLTQDITLTGNKNEETKGPCPECGVNTTKYGICKNAKCFFYGIRVL